MKNFEYLRELSMQVIRTRRALFRGPAYKQEEFIVTTLNNHNKHEEKQETYISKMHR